MEIAATISDAADIRAYDCLLPDFVKVSCLALRLAELMHLPKHDSNGRQIVYGLISKDEGLLDQNSSLAELALPSPMSLRLVPEIFAAADGAKIPGPTEATEPCEKPTDENPTDWDIIIGEPVALIHDDRLRAKLDVHIDAEVHRQIARFAKASHGKECVGLLLGTIEPEANARVIHISAAAPAKCAAGDSASIRISLDAWEEMLAIRDSQYPKLRVLGWFHSHAGWGFFMSDADMFIHRHFFPHPNMVAYVLDPTTGRDGFFYWHEGRISICPNYGVVGSSAELKSYGLRQKAAKRVASRQNMKACKWIAAALAAALLYVAFAGSSSLRRSKEPEAPKPAAVAVSPPAAVPASQQPTPPKAAPASKDGEYVIGKHDNPWGICNKVYKDGDLAGALMRYNGLKSATGLQVGQKIKLPPKETLRKLRKR